MAVRAPWQKEFVVYYVRYGTFRKAFNLESSARRSVTCANRNFNRSGSYAYTTWDDYWERINPCPKI
jgi:hypothetical protein